MSHIEFISKNKDSQEFKKLEALAKLLTKGMVSKGDLMEIVYDPEDRRKVDSAYPLELGRAIEENYTNFHDGQYVYDYSRHSWGELRNVNDLVVSWLFSRQYK